MSKSISKNRISVLYLLTGLLLIMVSAVSDMTMITGLIKEKILFDPFLHMVPALFFRVSCLVLGICLLILPWIPFRTASVSQASTPADTHRWFLIIVMGLTLAITLSIYRFVFLGMLITPDEYAYDFQARLFAQGSLSARTHPLQVFFEAPYIAVHKERLFSIFPSGWSLLLSLGSMFSVPWLINPLLGVMMGYESVTKDLRQAKLDEDVAAVVFRVNSGGGDHLTSDLIGHEIEMLAKEKPVVISMVDVAASGGYSISCRVRVENSPPFHARSVAGLPSAPNAAWRGPLPIKSPDESGILSLAFELPLPSQCGA